MCVWCVCVCVVCMMYGMRVCVVCMACVYIWCVYGDGVGMCIVYSVNGEYVI